MIYLPLFQTFVFTKTNDDALIWLIIFYLTYTNNFNTINYFKNFSDDKELLDSYSVTIDGEIITANDDSFNTSVLLKRKKCIRKEKKINKQVQEKLNKAECEKIFNKKAVFESSEDSENRSNDGEELESSINGRKKVPNKFTKLDDKSDKETSDETEINFSDDGTKSSDEKTSVVQNLRNIPVQHVKNTSNYEKKSCKCERLSQCNLNFISYYIITDKKKKKCKIIFFF